MDLIFLSMESNNYWPFQSTIYDIQSVQAYALCYNQSNVVLLIVIIDVYWDKANMKVNLFICRYLFSKTRPSMFANFRSEERRVGKSVDLGGRRIIKKNFFQAEDGIRDCGWWLEFRRVLFRSGKIESKAE